LQDLKVFHAVGSTQRPRSFVFKSARRAPILRLVRHREMGRVHFADAATGDGAAKTGLVGDQLRLAVALARRGHGFGRDVPGVFKLHVLVVTCRQTADLIDHVHQHLRAKRRQALTGNGVVGEDFFLLVGHLHEGLGVADIAHAPGAAHRYRLEVFAAHDGAHPRAAGGAVQVIDNRCIQHAVFARLANA